MWLAGGGSAQLVVGEHDVLYNCRVSRVSREDEEERVAQFTCCQCTWVLVKASTFFCLPARPQRHMPVSEGDLRSRLEQARQRRRPHIGARSARDSALHRHLPGLTINTQ